MVKRNNKNKSIVLYLLLLFVLVLIISTLVTLLVYSLGKENENTKHNVLAKNEKNGQNNIINQVSNNGTDISIINMDLGIDDYDYKYMPNNFNSRLIELDDVENLYDKYDDEKWIGLEITGYSETGFDNSKWGWSCSYGDIDDIELHYIWNGRNDYSYVKGGWYPEEYYDDGYNQEKNCIFVYRFSIPKNAEIIGVTDGWNVVIYEDKPGSIEKHIVRLDEEYTNRPPYDRRAFWNCLDTIPKNLNLLSDYNQYVDNCYLSSYLT